MVAQLTYVLTVDCRDEFEKVPVIVQELAPKLMERGISSLYVRRAPGSGIEPFIKVSEAILKRGFLPIIELHPADPTPPIRNLAETCCLGTLTIALQGDSLAFNPDQFLDILNGAGRFRLPIDIVFDPGGANAQSPGFRDFLPKLEFLVRRYSHVQCVKLVSSQTPDNAALDLFAALMTACLKSIPSISSDLWPILESAYRIARDLEVVTVDLKSKGDPLASTAAKAKSEGIELLPRLPLTTQFYRKGWFAFEVGKVFDSWVGKKAFKYYSVRPGWIED